MSEPNVTVVPAVAKAIGIVRFLNEQPGLEASLRTLSAELGITKSHCHNILKTLLGMGWVTFDEQRRVYALASRLLADIGRLVARQGTTSGLLHDEIVRLSAKVNTTCVISRVDPDGSFVVVDKADEGAAYRVSVPVGHRFAPFSTAQFRVRLAWSDQATLERELAAWTPEQRTPTSILSRSAMAREIAATRARGYAVSRAEYTPGVMTFAAPVFDAFGNLPLMLVSLGVAEDLEQRQDQLAAELLASVKRINAVYGKAPTD